MKNITRLRGKEANRGWTIVAASGLGRENLAGNGGYFDASSASANGDRVPVFQIASLLIAQYYGFRTVPAEFKK
jgi:hypothetical protein